MKEKDLDAAVRALIGVPPDPEGMNEDRSGWALTALKAFAAETRQNIKNELPEIVGDLLADLHHFCDRNGLDFEERLRNAQEHYEAETAESEDQS